MNRRKLNSLKRELLELRRSPQRAATLERFAARLGRKRIKGRGKEPMWVSVQFDHLYPLSIPHHGGRDLAKGTQRSILGQLEDDVLAWEERLGDVEDEEAGENGKIDDGEDDGTG